MRKSIVLTCLAMIIISSINGQTQKPYPIPSFGIQIDEYGVFCETVNPGGSDAALAKKDGCIKIYSKNSENTSCFATVLWYCLESSDVLGPYTVLCDETLVVTLDEREWGVVVQSDYEISVDVWIVETESQNNSKQMK